MYRLFRKMVIIVSPAKQKRDMYCFSGVLGGGVNFFGSCLQLEELRSTLCSILSLDLLFTVH